MTKKILLFILLTSSLSTFSQWITKAKKDIFDGNYRSAMVIGSGGKFPYTKPILVVNYFEKSENINIYISNAGYSGCDNKVIYLNFDGDDIIYQSTSIGEDSEKDTWFIETGENYMQSDIQHFNNDQELIFKLTKHNLLNVRMKSNCSSSDYKFSLKGSTRALNFVLGKEYLETYKLKKEERKKRLREEKIKEDKNLRNFIDSLSKNNKLQETIVKFKSLYKRYSNDRFVFYIVNSKNLKFFEGVPEFGDVRYIKKGTLFVIDKSFDNGKFRRVEYIDGIGASTHYIPENSDIKEYKKGLIKQLISLK